MSRTAGFVVTPREQPIRFGGTLGAAGAIHLFGTYESAFRYLQNLSPERRAELEVREVHVSEWVESCDRCGDSLTKATAVAIHLTVAGSPILGGWYCRGCRDAAALRFKAAMSDGVIVVPEPKSDFAFGAFLRAVAGSISGRIRADLREWADARSRPLPPLEADPMPSEPVESGDDIDLDRPGLIGCTHQGGNLPMHLTPKRTAAAIRFNKRSLYAAGGRSPEWVTKFWANHTSQGAAMRDARGWDPNGMVNDRSFIHIARNENAMVSMLADDGGIQDLVYGDLADAAMGVPQRPATEAERDGRFGDDTFRRMVTYLDALKPLSENAPWHERNGVKPVDHLVIKGVRIEVPGVKIVSFDEPGGLGFPGTTRRGYSRWRTSQKPHLIWMQHWDAALSARKAFKILVARGYASAFGIDNPSKTDGEVVVYQWLDPGLYRAAHGGSKPNKMCFASVDYSNAVYVKYAQRYLKMTGQARPVIKGCRNNGRSTLLGLYKGQIVAGMRIQAALAKHLGFHQRWNTGRSKKPDFFPRQAADPSLWTTDWSPDRPTTCTHLEYTKKKWDVAGLVDQICVLALTDSEFLDEFPWLEDNFRLGDTFWADWLESVKREWTWQEAFGS